MLNFRRPFVAATIVFVLLSSILFLPENATARARCPIRIPDSLLTLYLKSDLIVTASVTSEKVLKTNEVYEHGSYYDVEKILEIDRTLKGQKLNRAAYKTSEYKPKNPETPADEISKENEIYLSAGDKALFFLVKDAESGYYELADYVSAAKRLNDADLFVYEKRIGELKLILGKKQDRDAKLAEWLVRLVEESATREEGIGDLQASFAAAETEEEESEEPDTEETNKTPIAIDKNFRTANAPEIAEQLTVSQKARLSNALLVALSNDAARAGNAGNEEIIYPDYGFINLVSRWDKQNFAMNLFANLQNADGASRHKILYLMNAVAYFLEDENLYHIANEYEYALAQADDEKTEYTDNDAVISDSEDEAAADESETVSESVSNAETGNSAEAEKTGAAAVEEQAPVEEEIAADASEKLTYKQYRAKLFDSFGVQYGKVISQTVAK